MKNDWITIEAESVDEAKKMASDQMNVPLKKLQCEVLQEEKKTLFGKVKEQAKIRVKVKEEGSFKEEEQAGVKKELSSQDQEKVLAAKEYLTLLLSGLGVEEIRIEDQMMEDGRVVLNLQGEHINYAVGRRGATIDALQYLTSLCANQGSDEYLRFTLDTGEFRKKREETLKRVAERYAKKALRTGRRVTLEPMNPYERRIIHSEIMKIEGVTSTSFGEEPRRRVAIYAQGQQGSENRRRKKAPEISRDPEKRPSNRPSTYNFEKDFLKEREDAPIYSKIEPEDYGDEEI